MKARDNPFASCHIDRLHYRLSGATWNDVLSRLAHLHWRAAVVGPHGSGKTTFLDALERRLTQRGLPAVRLRLDDRNRRLDGDQRAGFVRACARGDFILLDGAEQLGWWSWHTVRRQARRASGLVITTHREGRLPVLLRCRTSPDLLAELAAGLLREEDPRRLLPQARVLFERHHGNLREALREWYDRVSGVIPPGNQPTRAEQREAREGGVSR